MQRTPTTEIKIYQDAIGEIHVRWPQLHSPRGQKLIVEIPAALRVLGWPVTQINAIGAHRYLIHCPAAVVTNVRAEVDDILAKAWG